MKRKFLALILTLLLIMTLAPGNVFASSQKESSAGSKGYDSVYASKVIDLTKKYDTHNYVGKIVIDLEEGTIQIDNKEPRELETPVSIPSDLVDPAIDDIGIPIMEVLEEDGKKPVFDDNTDAISFKDKDKRRSVDVSHDRKGDRDRIGNTDREGGRDRKGSEARRGSEARIGDREAENQILETAPQEPVKEEPIRVTSDGKGNMTEYYQGKVVRINKTIINSAELGQFGYEAFLEGSRIIIIKPFQTMRLVAKVNNGILPGSLGEVESVTDGDGTYVLQFVTEENTISAYEKLKQNTNVAYVVRDHIIYPEEAVSEEPEAPKGPEGPDNEGDISEPDVTGPPNEDQKNNDENSGITDEDPLEGDEEDEEDLSDDPEKIVFSDRWGAYRINSDRFIEMLEQDGKDLPVTVAVIDTGVDIEHEYLIDRIVPGYNIWDDSTNMYDAFGHGTHVAGIIADSTPENVKIMPVKVLDDNGNPGDEGDLFATFSSVVNLGITWAVDNGADVLNISLGGECYDDDCLIAQAVDYASSKNTAVVVAAGNESWTTDIFCPARTSDCITVAATSFNNWVTDFTNYGDAIDIAAPGDWIYSCLPENGSVLGDFVAPGEKYGLLSGTSMASPYVAGAVALLKVENSSLALNSADVHSIIPSIAVDACYPGKDPFFGNGILDFALKLGDDIPADSIDVYDQFIGYYTNEFEFYNNEWIHILSGKQPGVSVYPLEATNRSFTYTNSNPDIASFDGRFLTQGETEGTTEIEFYLPNGNSGAAIVKNTRIESWLDHAADSYAGGDGSKEDPYRIATPEQLAKLSYDMNTGDVFESDTKYYILTDNIDLGAHEWIPIGYRLDEGNGWFGTWHPRVYFDGNGYSINNLTTKYAVQRGCLNYFVGLFVGIVGAVNNVRLIDTDIEGGVYVGGIAGFNAFGIIKNCFVSGDISGINVTGSICGENDQVVSNCFSDAKVGVNTKYPWYMNDIFYMGGLIGASYGDVKNSYFSGTVDINESFEEGRSIGGFAGDLGCMYTFWFELDDTDVSGGIVSNSFYSGTCNADKAGSFAGTKGDMPEIQIKNSFYLDDGNPGIYLDMNPETTDLTEKDASFFGDPQTCTDVLKWDMENVWQQTPGGLPTLREQNYDPGDPNTEYKYTINDDSTVTIDRYWGNDSVFEIPDEIDGLPVTKIGNFAFAGSYIASIIIPESVVTIGKNAFEGCGQLTRITIPASVAKIDHFAFYGCYNLIRADFLGDAPASFGNYVFDGCAYNFRITYDESREGWTTPEWNGYPCKPRSTAPIGSISDVFPDTNLAQVIADELGKLVTDQVSRDDLESIFELGAYYCGINSLDGIENLTELIFLNLCGNAISDISDLAGLDNIRYLNLDNNDIQDISALQNLTNLVDLTLNDNKINDFSVLSGLQNLMYLNLNNTSIGDITVLKDLSHLMSLDLGNNPIDDISLLAGFTDLYMLGLANTGTSDISVLKSLTNLNSLDIWGNSITDISSLSGMAELVHLNAVDNNIVDISVLKNLTGLQELYMSDNSIRDISALKNLINLEGIVLNGNPVADISPLAGLTNLINLSFGENILIEDISALSGMTNLTHLYMNGNSIKDISPLKNLPELMYLFISGNSISDISPLAGMEKLEYADLSDQRISLLVDEKTFLSPVIGIDGGRAEPYHFFNCTYANGKYTFVDTGSNAGLYYDMELFKSADNFVGWYSGTVTVKYEGKNSVLKVTPSASVEKLNGNKNNLTIVIKEEMTDGTINKLSKTFSINNNAADTYVVGEYKVYVDTKGNTQIRECYIVK